VRDVCLGRARGHQNDLPVKARPQKSADEHRTLFWIENGNRLLLWQRPADSSLMPGFWELPEPEHVPGAHSEETLGSFRHTITFHKYVFRVERAQPPRDVGPCQWIEKSRLASGRGTTSNLALSTIFRKAEKLVSTARASAAAG
jgi:adenine-specific DNA glycosylase